MKFYARRQTNSRGSIARPWVNVTPSRYQAGRESTVYWGELCLPSFRRVFGFTPRKGVTYCIEGDFEVEEMAT